MYVRSGWDEAESEGGSGWSVTGMRDLTGGQIRSFFRGLFFIFPVAGMVIVRCYPNYRWLGVFVGFTKSVIRWVVDGPMLVEGAFRKKRGRRERGRGDEKLPKRVRFAMVVPRRSEWIFVVWWARAMLWCRPLVCSCSGCSVPTIRSFCQSGCRCLCVRYCSHGTHGAFRGTPSWQDLPPATVVSVHRIFLSPRWSRPVWLPPHTAESLYKKPRI